MTGVQLVRTRVGVRAEPQPAPEPGRPHVAVLAAGVCGTDVQIAARQRDDVAHVLGHEAVGLLDGTQRLVVFNPVDARDQDAILGHSFDGAFRSWVPVDDRPSVESLQEVAPLDPVGLLTLCEPLATVLYSWELIGDAPAGLSVGVWGAGPLGLLHAGEAAARGHDVELVHPRSSRLAWAAHLPFGGSLRRSVAGHRRPRALDVAIMCASRRGMGAAVAEAASALRPHGLMVLVAGLDEASGAGTFADRAVGRVRRRNVCGRIDRRHGIVEAPTRDGKPLRLTGHRGTSLRQLRAADAVIRRSSGRFTPLITHTTDPHGAAELINRRCSGASRDGAGSEIVKVVIEFARRG